MRRWIGLGVVVLLLAGVAWWFWPPDPNGPNAAGLTGPERTYVTALLTQVTTLDQVGTPVAAGTPYPVVLDHWTIQAQGIPPAPQRFTAAAARWAKLVQDVTHYASNLSPNMRYQGVDGSAFYSDVLAVYEAINVFVTPITTP